MNEFEKYENLNNFENQNTEDSSSQEDIVCVPSHVWNADDYQREKNCVSLVEYKNESGRKHKFDIKKYVAAAVIVSVLNLAILGGFFGAGYLFGSKKYNADSKSNVLSALSTQDDSSKSSPYLQQTLADGNELTTVAISQKVGPAVVGVTSTVVNTSSLFSSSYSAEGTGSGIILSSDGYIVTNAHVISGASAVKVTLNTGSEYTAKIVGTDKKTDLAVIKIDPKETLTVAELGDSTKIQVGERAIAIGNPLGMEFFGSTTQGIISAINRTITVDDRTMSVIQTDAAINEGNSGGALVNAYGKVIGINAVKIASSSVEGMGFAIPISSAKPVLEDLISYGYVKGRPVLGISVRDVTQNMATRQGWPIGVQIMDVQLGSGAEIAGLEQGDIIVKADGKTVSNFEGLNTIKDKHKPGEILKLEVYKYSTGLTEKVSVKLNEERPE